MYNTCNKQMLLEIFSSDKNKSYTAVELVELLKDKMNKATIYRQLIKMEENKEIVKFYNNKDDIYEYQFYQNCSEHLHLKCSKCGKIIHLKCDVANSFLNHILEGHGFLVDRKQTIIYGICKECRK